MKFNKLLSTAAVTTVLTAASASAETMINNLPDEGMVKVTGEVIAIEDSDEFTLSDNTGIIEVESETDLELAIGDNVIVTGEIDSGLFSNEIDASSVQKMDDVMDRSDNASIGAESYVLASEASPSYKNENYESQTKIVDGNTVVKDVSYDVDAEVEADIKKAKPVHEDAKDGSLEEYNNHHSKEVDLDADVEIKKEPKSSK